MCLTYPELFLKVTSAGCFEQAKFKITRRRVFAKHHIADICSRHKKLPRQAPAGSSGVDRKIGAKEHLKSRHGKAPVAASCFNEYRNSLKYNPYPCRRDRTG